MIAALGVSGPSARLEERLAPTGRFLITQSDKLSALLGKVGAA